MNIYVYLYNHRYCTIETDFVSSLEWDLRAQHSLRFMIRVNLLKGIKGETEKDTRKV